MAGLSDIIKAQTVVSATSTDENLPMLRECDGRHYEKRLHAQDQVEVWSFHWTGKKQKSALRLAESLDGKMQDQTKLSNTASPSNPRIILWGKNNGSGCTYGLNSVNFLNLKLVSRMLIDGHVQSMVTDAHTQICFNGEHMLHLFYIYEKLPGWSERCILIRWSQVGCFYFRFTWGTAQASHFQIFNPHAWSPDNNWPMRVQATAEKSRSIGWSWTTIEMLKDRPEDPHHRTILIHQWIQGSLSGFNGKMSSGRFVDLVDLISEMAGSGTYMGSIFTLKYAKTRWRMLMVALLRTDGILPENFCVKSSGGTLPAGSCADHQVSPQRWLSVYDFWSTARNHSIEAQGHKNQFRRSRKWCSIRSSSSPI